MEGKEYEEGEVEIVCVRDREATNVQPKGEIREVSMGLRWEAVKGRTHPLTRLSLGAPAPSCWTKLSG